MSYKQPQLGARHKQEKARVAGDKARLFIQGSITLGVIGLFMMVFDGMRREGVERSGQVVFYEPNVDVTTKGLNYTNKAKEGFAFAQLDQIVSDEKGSATIGFPEGSSIKIFPKTSLSIRGLDYRRSGRRDRTIQFDSGTIFARVSQNLGPESQIGILVGNGVINARQGAGFRVSAVSGGSAVVDVAAGKVVLRTSKGRREISAGGRGILNGNAEPTVGAATDGAAVNKIYQALERYDGGDNGFTGAERGVMRFVDPLFSRIGLNPGSYFNFMETDTARLAIAKTELLALRKALEGMGETPETLNPVTLEGVSLASGQQERLMGSLAGFTLDSYQKQGNNDFIIRARARDSVGTSLVLTRTGVKEGK
jgi:FecR protein